MGIQIWKRDSFSWRNSNLEKRFFLLEKFKSGKEILSPGEIQKLFFAEKKNHEKVLRKKKFSPEKRKSCEKKKFSLEKRKSCEKKKFSQRKENPAKKNPHESCKLSKVESVWGEFCFSKLNFKKPELTQRDSKNHVERDLKIQNLRERFHFLLREISFSKSAREI